MTATHHGPVPLITLGWLVATLLLLLPHVLDHQGRTQPVGCHLEILQYICILYFLYSKYRDFKMHLSSIEWLHCSEIVTHRVPVPVISTSIFNLHLSSWNSSEQAWLSVYMITIGYLNNKQLNLALQVRDAWGYQNDGFFGHFRSKKLHCKFPCLLRIYLIVSVYQNEQTLRNMIS